MNVARPDNSHLYAEAYAEAKSVAERLTIARTPVIPRTVLACAMLEVIDEMVVELTTRPTRECVAEDAGKAMLTLAKLAAGLPPERRAALDQCIAELLR